MIKFEGVEWIVPKKGDERSLSDSQFSVVPEPLILDIFSMAGQQNLSSLSSVCHLFHRISYDKTMICGDLETAIAILKDLFLTMRGGSELLTELDRLTAADVPLPVKLVKIMTWSRHLMETLPFETMISWSPASANLLSERRAYISLIKSYAKLWRDYVDKQLSEYRYVNLGYPMNEGAFDICLNTLIEKKYIPHLLLGEEITLNQVEKLSEALDSGRLTMEKFSFCGSNPIGELKKNRLLLALSVCSDLKEMSFSMSNLGDPDIVRIRELFQAHSQLESLSVSSFAFSEHGIRELLALYEHSPSLSVLSLGNCSEAELGALVELLEGGYVRELRVSCLSFSPEIENAIIKKMTDLPTVEHFHLYYRDHSTKAAFEFMEKALFDSPYYEVKERGTHSITLSRR